MSMTQSHTDQTRTNPSKYYKDEASKLRDQLSALVKEVRCTIAHPARPEGLREAIAQSQELLRSH